jgi:hypothetical protein
MSGDAALDVDFTSMRYDGTLHPLGTELLSGQVRDFGTWTFGGLLETPSSFYAPLMKNGFSDGNIDGRFFGPKGEEWGASVQLNIYNAQRFGETIIGGVVIGKRR